MPKRSSFGSLRKLPSGNYQAAIKDPDHPGKRLTAPTTFTTKAAARAWLAKQQADLERGTWRHPDEIAREREREQSRTLGRFVEQWWASDSSWAASTARAEKSRYYAHIEPMFGQVPLNEIDAEMVARWLGGLQSKRVREGEEPKPASPRSRQKCLQLLGRVFSEAVDRGVIEASPIQGRRFLQRAARVQPGEDSGQQERRLWPVEVIRGLLGEVPEHSHALWVLLAVCGLRSSEVRALRRCDIDLKGGWLHVRQTAVGAGKHLVVKAGGKSRAAVRSVPLAQPVIDELKRHCSAQGVRGREALLFEARELPGQPVPANTLREQSQRACKRLGLDGYVRPHELRHGVITRAQRLEGITLADVQEYCGHEKSGSVTMRYSHSDEEQQRKIASALAALYLGPASEGVIELKRAQR